MDKKGGRKDRRSVNIPLPMYEFVRDLISKQKLPGGYVSVDDFVRDLIRQGLRELGYKV